MKQLRDINGQDVPIQMATITWEGRTEPVTGRIICVPIENARWSQDRPGLRDSTDINGNPDEHLAAILAKARRHLT